MPPPGSTRTRMVWTPAEDSALLEVALAASPDFKWAEIARSLPGRSPLQCRQRWTNSLDPSINKAAWSQEEDAQLHALHTQHGDSWSTICKEIPGRTSQQCRYRWVAALDPSLNLGAWSANEDETLSALHAAHGNAWSRIAKAMHGRTDLQCRYRWVFVLEPAASPDPFSPAEDARLKELCGAHGQAWTKIAGMMPGRTFHQIRYRATTLLGPRTRKRSRAARKPRVANTGDDTASDDSDVGPGVLRELSENAPRVRSMKMKKMLLKRWEGTMEMRRRVAMETGHPFELINADGHRFGSPMPSDESLGSAGSRARTPEEMVGEAVQVDGQVKVDEPREVKEQVQVDEPAKEDGPMQVKEPVHVDEQMQVGEPVTVDEPMQVKEQEKVVEQMEVKEQKVDEPIQVKEQVQVDEPMQVDGDTKKGENGVESVEGQPVKVVEPAKVAEPVQAVKPGQDGGETQKEEQVAEAAG